MLALSRETRIANWHADHAELPLAVKLRLAWWSDYGFRQLYVITGRDGIYTTLQNTESETPVSVRVDKSMRVLVLTKKAKSLLELLKLSQGG